MYKVPRPRGRTVLVWSFLLALSSHDVRAANVAHEGFPDPAAIDAILTSEGHTVTPLTLTDVQNGELNAGGFDVFVIGHRSTMFGAASAVYVDEVATYISAGGNIVTEHTGAAMFFTRYSVNAFPSMTATPQLEVFDGIVHGGWPHQFNTTINLLDPGHPLVTGLPSAFAEGEGTEFFTWIEQPDPRLQILGDFIGVGGRDFPTGSALPCLMVGESGASRFVFGMWGYSFTLSRGENNLTLFLNAILYATGEFNDPPDCGLAGPLHVECAGDVTEVALDGSQSSDPNGDPLTYLWEVDCPEASFDDPSSPTPILTMRGGNCSVECNVTLTVDDGREATSCSTTVTVRDTSPPTVSCSVEATTEGSLVHFGAADECSDVTVTGRVELGDGIAIPVEDGQLLTCGELQESEAPRLVVMAEDACGNGTSCTSPIDVTCETELFIRGDFDADEEVNLLDPLLSLHHLLRGHPAVLCRDAADSNDDGLYNFVDPIHTLLFILSFAPPPPPPFPEAGADPTEDELDCEVYPNPDP